MGKKALIVTALAGFIRSFLINDIKILQEMGYEVHCAANKNHPGAGGIEEYFKEKDIIFHQVNFSSNRPISEKTIISIKQMKILINEYDFSFVHCHTPIAGAICRWVARKKQKKDMIVAYTTHGFYFNKRSSKKTCIIFRNIENFMSRFSDTIITINKEDYENAKKMKCSDVRYINGVGVDINKFSSMVIDREHYRNSIGIKSDEIMILAIGELSRRKNHQIIIKALAKIKDLNSVFVICGNDMNSDGTSQELKRLSEELGVKLKLMGLRNDIPEICKCADIGVLPSTREGLGLAGIEMLASGLPIVGSNVQGIIDYIRNGENGYLCDPNNEVEFSDSIYKLIKDKKNKNISEICAKSVLEFDIENSHAQMKYIYSDILKVNKR